MNNVTLQAQYTISAQSNQGMIRTNNEDNLLVVPLISESGVWSPTNSEDKYLQAFEVSIDSGKFGVILAVADGMGGANAGEVASKIAIDEISKARLSPGFDTRLTSDPMLVLKEILHQANASIIDFATQESSTKGMGTTLTLAFIGEKGGTVAWIGDSRAYLFRKKDGLKQISKDHSVVQELLDANQISEEIAFYHPESHVITQSLGDPARQIEPSGVQFDLMEGDVFLLCTDGLNGMLMDEEIARFFQNAPEESLEQLSDQLIQGANEAGGNDNISLVLFKLNKGALSKTVTKDEPVALFEQDKTETITFRNRLSLSPRRKQRKMYLIVVLFALVMALGFLLKITTFDQDSNTSLSPTDTVTIQKTGQTSGGNDTSKSQLKEWLPDTLKRDSTSPALENSPDEVRQGADTVKKK